MVELKLVLDDQGKVTVYWPQDRPFLTLHLLEVGANAVKQQCLQKEQNAILIAPAIAIPPARQR